MGFDQLSPFVFFVPFVILFGGLNNIATTFVQRLRGVGAIVRQDVPTRQDSAYVADLLILS